LIPRKTIKKFIASLSLSAFSSRRLSITGRPAWRVAVAAAALAVIAGGSPAQASEYSVKARFLVNFALYTYWPGTAFVDERSPVNICLYGRDPFGAVLDEAAGARQYVAGSCRCRSLDVWRIETAAELTEPVGEIDAWQEWRHSFDADAPTDLVARAVDTEGNVQPEMESDAFPDGRSGWVSRTIEP
jgi:hypothetical protein